MSADKILIIEDDPTMQEILRDNFEFVGATVHLAADGRAGLRSVLACQPDLILLDIMLPGINGFDLCRRIRGEGLTTPILMLTAKSQESDIVRRLNLGADDYVQHRRAFGTSQRLPATPAATSGSGGGVRRLSF